MKYPLYNNKLCPDLWSVNEDGYKLDPEVRDNLYKIAQDFVTNFKKEKEIEIPIRDIVLLGSITNYNWTPYSDIDLHIITDFSSLGLPELEAKVLFDSVRSSWNKTHNIVMKGHDVELYVQDLNEENKSPAEYSILNNKWITQPKKETPTFDKELIKKKYTNFKRQLDALVVKHDEAGLKRLLEKLYKYRQAGLDDNGDLSEENIVFKIFRAKGNLDKLRDYINKFYDKEVSVNEIT